MGVRREPEGEDSPRRCRLARNFAITPSGVTTSPRTRSLTRSAEDGGPRLEEDRNPELIEVFSFPLPDRSDDQEEVRRHQPLRDDGPFAIIVTATTAV
jgi:hypothetical protein